MALVPEYEYINDQHRAATGYAARGWRVIPLHSIVGGRCTCRGACDSPGKHPRAAWKDQATTDPGVIAGLWRDHPDSNVGIVTGAGSGVVVLDVDGPEGEASLAALEAQWEALPETVEALTGRGRHIYFAHPGRTVSNTVELAPGLDVRGDGGYVVAPPSLHISGNAYQWDGAHHPDDLDPAPLPSLPYWLRNLIDGGGSKVAPGATGAPITEGRRNADLTSLAGTMREKGMGRAAIEAALLAENSERVTPPLPVVEVVKIAASVASYPPGRDDRVRSRGNGAPAGSTGHGGALARPVIESIIETGTEWAARADITPAALIPGVLAAGGLAVMAGDGKTGKSWAAYSMALAVRYGVDYFDAYPVAAPGRVLIIAAEGVHADTVARIKGLARGMGMDPDDAVAGLEFIWRRKGVKLDDTTWFVPELARIGPGYSLIVCDVLRNLWDGDEQSNNDLGRLCRNLTDTVTITGPTVLLLHHAVKSTENSRGRSPFQNIRGGSALRDAYDSGFYLERGKDATRTTVYLESRAGAPAPGFTFTWPLTTQDGSEPIDLDYQSDTSGLTGIQQQMNQAAAIIRREPGQSQSQIVAQLDGRKATAIDALHALSTAGVVEARPGFEYTDKAGRSRRRSGYFPSNGIGSQLWEPVGTEAN